MKKTQLLLLKYLNIDQHDIEIDLVNSFSEYHCATQNGARFVEVSNQYHTVILF